MTVTRVAIRKAITFLEAPPGPVALLPAPPQPVALLPAWTESTLAAMSPTARKWEEDWGNICDQSARIDRLLRDIQDSVRHWEPEVERVELVGGHYLRRGVQMISWATPKWRRPSWRHPASRRTRGGARCEHITCGSRTRGRRQSP